MQRKKFENDTKLMRADASITGRATSSTNPSKRKYPPLTPAGLIAMAGILAAGWGVPLREAIPVPGKANATHWRGTAPDTMNAAGRNHPLVGQWLAARWGQPGQPAADPMIGVGGLWLRVNGQVGSILGVDVEPKIAALAKENLGGRARVSVGSAVTWTPSTPVAFVMTSPPYAQSHSAGATPHQQAIIRKKSAHALQAFGGSAGNLALLKGDAFWAAMEAVYRKVSTYLAPRGHLVVVLRNLVRDGLELDHVSLHIAAMRRAGFKIVGVHPRDLQAPSMYEAWKVARNPTWTWVRLEWAIVCAPKNGAAEGCTAA